LVVFGLEERTSGDEETGREYAKSPTLPRYMSACGGARVVLAGNCIYGLKLPPTITCDAVKRT